MLRSRRVRRLAAAAAARAGRDLVLVYHRVVPDGAQAPWRVVPAVSAQHLRAQLEVLAEAGDVVPLADLLEPSERRRRPRFAVTFDDDYQEHLSHALPVLRQTGTPATFFLGGRALAGQGPYWWQRLEALLQGAGPAAAARQLGVPDVGPASLGLACETRPELQVALGERVHAAVGNLLDHTGLVALATASEVTVGFHTVEHPVLTRLDDAALASTLVAGRAALADVVGAPLSLFAYPHGKADLRVADAVRQAGYRAAWTGAPRPLRPGDDAALLGRWECGDLDADAFSRRLAVRLHRAAPVA